MEANANSFPFDLNVFHMPVNNRGGEVTYEPVESDLVCFVEGSQRPVDWRLVGLGESLHAPF